MSVSPMKSISIIGLMPDLEKVITACGASEVFHPDEVSNFYSDTRNFVHIVDKNPYTEPLDELSETLAAAKIDPQLTDIKKFNVTDNQITDFVKSYTTQLDSLIAQVAQKQQLADKYKTDIAQASHFVGYDLPMDRIRACKFIKTNFGRLPVDSYEKLNDYKDNPYVVFFPCTKDENYYWGVYVSPIDQSEDVDRIFSGLFFEQCQISGLESTPEKNLQVLNEKVAENSRELKQAQQKMSDFIKQNQKQCDLYYTKLTQMVTYYNTKSVVMKYNKSFIIVGWIPAENEKSFVEGLDGIRSAEWTLSDGKDMLEKSPPIKLKNNFFTKPYEFYLKMFGLPKYNEIDPTGFMAITFTVLFGIMFGDFGHGIVLIIAGVLMWKMKKMELGKVLIPCGISGAVFGLIFGSAFGFEHAFDGLYSSIFGLSEKPVDVMEPNTTNVIIYSAVGIGFLLVVLAMIVNIYTSLRQKNLENALFGSSGVAGLVFYGSLVAGLAVQLLFGVQVLTVPYVLCLIILPLLVIYMREPLGNLVSRKKNWQPEKWSEYLVQNFFELFETLLSYVTNTMSFLRVGAFVLVHAGMMMVVFKLAEMLPGVGYVIILILGNLLVIALEGLLVSIQVLRLEFYEMFSRFYTGSGRPFNPITIKKLKNN